MTTVTAASSVVSCPSCGQRNRLPVAASGTPRCPSCHAPLPWIVDAGEDDFDRVVGDASTPVLVDLWAPWCGPCRMVSPALEKLARDYAGRVKLVKVNVDEAPGISQRFGVQGIPTLLVSDGGRILDRRTGAAPESQLRAWLDGVLASRRRRG
ncbi:MAG: thioredoxin [Acidimicrobiia bacterium]|nr:thioredoxin [Acidimicrobiia bacterium]